MADTVALMPDGNQPPKLLFIFDVQTRPVVRTHVVLTVLPDRWPAVRFAFDRFAFDRLAFDQLIFETVDQFAP